MRLYLRNINKYYLSLILVAGMACAISICAYLIVLRLGLSTIYNDSMSHLNLARLVIDNLQPGLTQLGGDWLPLNHLLMVPLIWNNWAWHSGFAGSFFSMISYIFAVVCIFLSVRILTKKDSAAIIGALVYALNLNILYLQSTPLTESLYLVLYCASFLYFIRWITFDNLFDLIILGAFGFLQIMTRYDGWFIFAITAVAVVMSSLTFKKLSLKQAFSRLVIYSFPCVFALAIWLVWNKLIFNDPLYFAFGPYSAHSQQHTISSRVGLITQHNWLISFLAYGYAALDNVGRLLLPLGLYSSVIYLLMKDDKQFFYKLSVVLLGFAPMLFHLISLYRGFSVINVPELGWNTSEGPSGAWFNVRYGITALPFAAITVGLLARSGNRSLLAILFILIVFQQFFTYRSGIITILDGTVGSSSFASQDIAIALKKNVKHGERVLMANSFFNAVSFQSGLDLKEFIHEGVSTLWSKAIVNPQDYGIKYIVTTTGDVGEQVYTSLVIKGKSNFLKYYKPFYYGRHANIFVLRDPDEIFVSRRGKEFYKGNEPFTSIGANSYDLAYKSNDEIDTTLGALQSAGANTVRIWLFGEGLPEGFQPKSGQMNEGRFRSMDYLLYRAKTLHMKIIPTLTNNWEDFGGKSQYLKWLGQNPGNADAFYTNSHVVGLFENYVNYVLSRTNTYTHQSYANDPTIMAWDIMNEPRESSATSLEDWTDGISRFIRDRDHNHLITVGTERVIDDSSEKRNTLCGLPDIDFCSLHLYFETDNKPLFSRFEDVRNFLVVQNPEKLQKPVMIEETGIDKTRKPFSLDNIDVMRQVREWSLGSHYDGFLVWNWSMTPDNSFGFSLQTNKPIPYNERDLGKILK